MRKYLNSLNNNYNDSVIFNDDDYNTLIEEYNDIKDNSSEKENNDM